MHTLVLLLALSASASGQITTLGFDEVGAPGPFKFIVPGFDNGPLLQYPEVTLDGGVVLSDVLFGNSATTAPNIYATCDSCFLGDGSGLPGRIFGGFSRNVSAIGLDVYNGVGWGPGTFTLRAFDADRNMVAIDQVVAGPMGQPSFVQHLQLSGSAITSFEVTTDLVGYSFAIDTLQFAFEELGTPGCSATANSSGAGGAISATGSTSVAANNLHLSANSLPASTFGLFFYGPSAVQLPFGDGVRCVDGSLFRLDVGNTGPSGVLTDEIDLSSPPNPAGQVLPGSVWHYQGWFRDVAAGGAGFNTSDSLSLTFTN